MRAMAASVADSRPAGPDTPFAIAPDDETRRRLVRWHAAYGDVYRVLSERGKAPHWVVHDPNLVQQVLVRRAANYTKGEGLERVKILLGNGIMVSEGDFWARQRLLLQPAFRPRQLADFSTMIFDENAALAARWAATEECVDVAAYVSELILVIVLKSIFGADYARLIAEGEHSFALLTEVPERNLAFAARFHQLKKMVAAIVDARQAGPCEHCSHAGFDFLGHMLAAKTRSGEGMTRRALIDEVMTLIVAGHETTASVLAWAWYLLAAHPEVCARLQAEVDAIDEDRLRTTGGADMGLAYTEQVIFETLRLYPPGWLLSRRAQGPDRLGAHAIGPGTQVFISPYILHRHAHYWHEPERFDPARFKRGEPAHRFAYLPFAAGPRHCVGEHLAATEMRVHLAMLLRRFTPRCIHNTPPALEARINLRPSGGIYLQLARR
jgi:cytochrome P450